MVMFYVIYNVSKVLIFNGVWCDITFAYEWLMDMEMDMLQSNISLALLERFIYMCSIYITGCWRRKVRKGPVLWAPPVWDQCVQPVAVSPAPKGT